MHKHKATVLLLLSLLVFVLHTPVRASIPNWNYPLWIWPTIYITSTTSLPAEAVAEVAVGWSDFNVLYVDNYPWHNDINIYDNNNLPTGRVGRSTVKSQYYTPCFMKQDTCGQGLCFDNHIVAFANLELNANLITSTVQQHQQDGWTLFGFTASTLSHEMGHVLGLSDVSFFEPNDCSEVDTVMFASAVDLMECERYFPMNNDGTGLYWAYDEVGYPILDACEECYTTCPCGQPCNEP